MNARLAFLLARPATLDGLPARFVLRKGRKEPFALLRTIGRGKQAWLPWGLVWAVCESGAGRFASRDGMVKHNGKWYTKERAEELANDRSD